MKLYGTVTSPYVRKVRAFALERGIELDFVTEGPHDAAGNVPRLNPLGKIPLLVLEDGEILFDSPFIIDYLDGLGGRPGPASGGARWRAQRWHALAQGICDAAVARLMETRRTAAMQDPALIARHERRITAAVAFAEDRVAEGAPALEGGSFGVADIAMAVALEYVDLRHPHDWREEAERLARWLAQAAQRPSLQATRFPAS